ncbi:C4-dicarboxylate transporter/malic acid transport protein-like protein [Lophiostoma macrostomum CBS 122681]|uniref:Sulfite efflux pump SSU1 n=1 Tax=Lophiostoma macrostomum CBS 122681 TaxID=1314788 RepID=A0A6A6TIX1_9PLEO|nr:C4-dicarboxylate transporter/malic acid transport protein-like protein [Lophiostoma macrostomum CBS 122681]
MSTSRSPLEDIHPRTNVLCTAALHGKQAYHIDQPLPKWLIRPDREGWRRAVQNFTPSWFAITMGTGIVSILLHALSNVYPGHQSLLNVLSIVFFALNVLLFSAILVLSILRYVLYPATWGLLLQHPVQSLFLGTLPMGFATIVNMFTLVCVPSWGGRAAQAAWAMWWVDSIVSVACCLGLPFQMMTKHKNKHETMTATWLLPVVAPIVSAASGAVVASALPNSQHALWTVIISYVQWGMGVPLALVVTVIYFRRLAVHELPSQEVIVSVFLPLGPMGQGGYAIMALGSQAMRIFPETKTLHTLAGDVLYVLGFGVAIIMWGFGLVWLFFAIASISRSKFPFNMGWWGFTFPVGVFAMSTLTLGQELPSALFRILGTVLAICVMLLWLLVAAGTVKNLLFGNMIEAPCLREMEKASRLALVTEEERQDA